MKLSTQVCLVLLRLAIGWHFLFEGLEKINSYQHPSKPAWSSESYLRESASPGVLGKSFRWLAGDEVLDRCTLVPLTEGADPATVPAHQQLPLALEKDWRGFLDRFVAYYGLDAEQKTRADAVHDQRAEQTVLWLRGQGDHGVMKVTRTAPAGNGSIDVNETMPERIREYREKVAHLHAIEESEAEQFGAGARKKLDDAKADVRKLRGELQKAVTRETTAFADALKQILTPEQRAKTPELEPLESSRDRIGGLTESARLALADQYEPVGRKIFWDYDLLDWVDFLTRWGLVVVGICLLAGLLTRTACIAGVVFLLMLVLAMLPLPGAPELVKQEGRLFINKNVVEALALLTLSTTASGRWLGLDGMLQFLRPSRWRRTPAPAGRVRVSSTRITTPSNV